MPPLTLPLPPPSRPALPQMPPARLRSPD
jgi:hypothetical protein